MPDFPVRNATSNDTDVAIESTAVPVVRPAPTASAPLTPGAWIRIEALGLAWREEALPSGAQLHTFHHVQERSSSVTVAAVDAGRSLRVVGGGEGVDLWRFQGAWGLASEGSLPGGSPRRIGNTYLAIHRGRLISALLPSQHSVANASLPAHSRLPPSPTTALPQLVREPVSPYTAYANDTALNAAVDCQTSWSTADALTAAVLGHIDAHSGDAGRPTMILVGENHELNDCMLVTIAVLGRHAVDPTLLDSGSTPQPQYLVEQDEGGMTALVGKVLSLQAELDPLLSQPESSTMAATCNEVLGGYQGQSVIASRAIVKAYLGACAGMDVQPFDMRRGTCTDLLDREAGMVASLRERLHQGAGGAPLIVSAGLNHVGPLHEALSGECNLIVVSCVTLATGSPLVRRRMSYLMSHPDPRILTYRSNAELESRPLNFVQEASRRGVVFPTPGGVQPPYGVASSSRAPG